MALGAVRVQIGPRAFVQGTRRAVRIRHRWQRRRRGRDGGAEHPDGIERYDLVCAAAGLRVRERAVQLRQLQSKAAPGRFGVTGETLRLARVDPRLARDGRRLAADHAGRVRALRVPFVRVTSPLPVRVPHEEPRFHASRAEAEILHEDRADGKLEVAVGSGANRGAVGQRQESLLVGTVRPEWCVRRIGNQPGRRSRCVTRRGRSRSLTTGCESSRRPSSPRRDGASVPAVVDHVELTVRGPGRTKRSKDRCRSQR